MTKYDRYIRAPSDKTRYLDLKNFNLESKWWEIPPKYITDEREREKYNKLK